MQLTYLEAIRQGIWEEMERDPSVFCIGEDIGIYGGAFKVTDGFIDRLGQSASSIRRSRSRLLSARRLAHRSPECARLPNSSSWISSAARSTRFPTWSRRPTIDGEPRAAGFARSKWRQCSWRSIPFAESRDVVRPQPRIESCLSGQRLRCKRTDQGSDPRQQSRHLLRA